MLTTTAAGVILLHTFIIELEDWLHTYMGVPYFRTDRYNWREQNIILCAAMIA